MTGIEGKTPNPSRESKTLRIAVGDGYDVMIGEGLLDRLGTLVTEVLGRGTVCVVADDTVDALYGDRACRSLREAGFAVCRFVFAQGELSKTLRTYRALLDKLAEHQLTRTDGIVALGGGVTGDLAGFAAATYLRGIRIVQVPTTLLAAVDSSVGGKTGVNLDAGKNLVGAFCQPSLVVCDPMLLSTLPKEIVSEGTAEVLKCGMIADRELFWMAAGSDARDGASEWIERCVRIKGKLVAADERDIGERRLLNFGHTVGHAIEKLSNFTISHGRAVAIGMVVMAQASWQAGLSAENCAPPIREALRRVGLPQHCTYTARELAAAARGDKKRSGSRLTLVIPQRIGSCVLYPIEADALEAFLSPAQREDA